MSSNCIADAVNEGAEPLILIRSMPGAYDENGYWQDKPSKTISIKGAVQPLRPEEISRLEDSRHITEAFKIYTTADIKNLSLEKQTQPDTIIRKSKEYEVYSSADWGSYLKILIVRKE